MMKYIISFLILTFSTAQAETCFELFKSETVVLTSSGTPITGDEPLNKTLVDIKRRQLLKLFETWDKRIKSLREIQDLTSLEDFIDRIRKDNGESNRQSDSIEDKKMKKLKELIEIKDNSAATNQAINLFRRTFRAVEMGYFIVLQNQKRIDLIKFNLKNAQITKLDAEDLLRQLIKENNIALAELGKNYGLYKRVRDYLEGAIKIEPDSVKGINAKKIFSNLGARNMIRLYPEIGIKAVNNKGEYLRPTTEQVRDVFQSHPAALSAYLKKVRNEELLFLGQQIAYLAGDGVRDLISKLPLPAGVRDFIMDFNEMSSDVYLLTKYQEKIDAVMTIDSNGNGIMDIEQVSTDEKFSILDKIIKLNSGTNNEFLKAFVRLVGYTEHWNTLKAFAKEQSGTHPLYEDISKKFDAAEEYARKKGESLPMGEDSFRSRVGRLVLKYGTVYGLTQLVTEVNWTGMVSPELQESVIQTLEVIKSVF